MRILFLSSYIDPGAGPSILVRLASRLKQEGHTVKILTTTAGYDSDIIEAVRLPKGLGFINKVLNKIVPNYFSFSYFPLLAAARKYKPDVINIHWTHGPTIPIRVIPELSLICPVFWTIHDMWPITTNTYFDYTGGKILLNRNTVRKQELKRLFKFSPRVLFKYKVSILNRVKINTISPSRWLQMKVNASPVFRSATNHHIPNGVDINVFKPLDQNNIRKKYGISQNRRVILFLTANLADKRKGFYYFSKALEYLKTTDPGLVDNIIILLVGENSEGANKYLPTDIINLGSTKDVSRLVEYYNIADIFVSASIADNFPSTLLESVACGTPVVAFDVGGVSEIVMNNKTGLLVDSKNEKDLAEKIEKLLIDNNMCHRFSMECRTHAVSNFNMEKFVNSYVGLFVYSTSEHAQDNSADSTLKCNG